MEINRAEGDHRGIPPIFALAGPLGGLCCVMPIVPGGEFWRDMYISLVERGLERALSGWIAATGATASSASPMSGYFPSADLPARTASMNLRALEVMTSKFPSRRARASTSSPPTATAAAESLSAGVMPLV